MQKSIDSVKHPLSTSLSSTQRISICHIETNIFVHFFFFGAKEVLIKMDSNSTLNFREDEERVRECVGRGEGWRHFRWSKE